MNYREKFTQRLRGVGIEIGALHRPCPTHDGMRVKYVDHCGVEELRKQYPEFNELRLAETDIIDDAQVLRRIPSEQFDFVIASHVVEHMSSAILAIKNWLRVIKADGLLYVVVPSKDAIFDRKRSRTTLLHVVSDYRYLEGIETRNWEHYLDYALHVDNDIHFGGTLSPDELITHAKKLKYTGYSIHYHCWLPADFLELLLWIKQNVQQFNILEFPPIGKDDSEFHVLIEKA